MTESADRPAEPTGGATELPILARGPGWVVVDKPSGLACHYSKMVRERDTVAARLRTQLDSRIHLAHRLDRGASGCLLVALDAPSKTRLQDALATAHKEYVALVRGFFRWDDPVRVQTPMKDARGRIRDAETTVEVIGRSHDPRASLMLARPVTGRFHQVRRHLRDLDHPILGDRKHGDNRASNLWKDQLPRLALHCRRIHIASEDIDVLAPLSGDFLSTVQRMPWWAEAQERLG